MLADVHPLLALGLALVVGLLLLIAAHRSPRLAVTATLCSLCFTPVWVGVGLGFNGNLFLPLATVASIACAAVLLPVAGFRASPVDALLLFLVVLAASSLLTSDRSLALSFLITPFTFFVGGYLFGRIATAKLGLDFVSRAIAVVFTIVAVLAIVEFVTGFNPFVLLRGNGSLYGAWGQLQERGGLLRAEGAFGHSIALGSSLALAAPIALASTFRFSVRLAMVAVMTVATVLTFSRIGIICLFLGVALCVALVRDRFTGRERGIVAAGSIAVALAMLPFVSGVFLEAGDEASNSADYRGELIPLLQHANLVGFSPIVHHSPTGQLSFGDFESIDSQLVLTALTTGSLALVAVCIALVAAIVLCLRGRASVATIAIVAQIPALATVALITQYSIMLWLVVGVAATSQALQRAPVQRPARVLPHFRYDRRLT